MRCLSACRWRFPQRSWREFRREPDSFLLWRVAPVDHAVLLGLRGPSERSPACPTARCSSASVHPRHEFGSCGWSVACLTTHTPHSTAAATATTAIIVIRHNLACKPQA